MDMFSDLKDLKMSFMNTFSENYWDDVCTKMEINPLRGMDGI